MTSSTSRTFETIKEVAQQGADSIGRIKFDNVVAIDTGGDGNSQSAVTRLMTAAPASLVTFMEQMKALTGIDMSEILSEITSRKGEGPEQIARDTSGRKKAKEDSQE